MPYLSANAFMVTRLDGLPRFEMPLHFSLQKRRFAKYTFVTR
jgi:hypothetical protein